ncbi:hypothetical protein QUA20_03375 [Microcoleus sp. Pol7_A1]
MASELICHVPAFSAIPSQEVFHSFDLQSRPFPPGWKSQRARENPIYYPQLVLRMPAIAKSRYTYIDAGASAQVFNCVIYPSHNYDLPLLGIDLLYFGKKKIWVFLDFQPLFRDEAYIAKYIQHLESLRDKYHDLSQNL